MLIPMEAEAQGPQRLALLIANQGYGAAIGPLKNPHNDVRRVGAALVQVGFDVGSPLREATREQILLAVHEFADRLKAAGPGAVGFFYYSGHGVAVGGENLLLPVNIKGASARELEIAGVGLAGIIATLQESAPQAAHFVVFDACRNNLGGARGSRGFVAVTERPGMLVAFSTSPGNTASDEGGESGPYATALAAEMTVPGRNHDDMFFEVRRRVADLTRQEQVPWTQDGLLRQVVFGEGPKAAPALGQAGTHSEAEQVWLLTKESTDKTVLEAFIARYGDTFYAELARARLRELQQGKAAPSKVAALPKIETPQGSGQFEGTWMVRWSVEYGCGRSPYRRGAYQIRVADGGVSGRNRLGAVSGRITNNGAIRWSFPSPKATVTQCTGTLRGEQGSGYCAPHKRCRMQFAVQRMGKVTSHAVPTNEHPFDGAWVGTFKAPPPCHSGEYVFQIQQSKVRIGGVDVTVGADGAITVVTPSLADPSKNTRHHAKLGENAGSGSFEVIGTPCAGTWAFKREVPLPAPAQSSK
jgi:hypothetical protein